MTSAEGKDFEVATARAFRLLGLGAEARKETQAEADILVYAEKCERPFGVVVECTAKQGRRMVGQAKVGQVRSYATQYVTLFQSVSRVFLCIVGRPTFSRQAVRASRGGGKKGDRGVSLLRFDTLGNLILMNELFPLSQEDLREVFSYEGEVSKTVDKLEVSRNQLLASYAAVLATVDHETNYSGRTVTSLRKERLVGAVNMVLQFRDVGIVADELIERAVSDLSSPLIDLIRVGEGTVRRTSHEIPSRLAQLGKTGDAILQSYDDTLKFLQKHVE